MSKSSQREERRHWAIEKPKFDNARKWRGIYYIDTDDMEFEDTMKNVSKKLEVPLNPPCLAKLHVGTEACCTQFYSRKIRYECIIEAQESTRTRIGTTQPRDHEDLFSEKGFNSLSHHNFAHKPFAIPQAMKIPYAEATVDKEWKKLEKLPAWQVTNVKSKKEVIEKTQTKGRTVHFATLMDLCHLKNSELDQQFQKYRGLVVLRGDVVKDDSGSYAVFTEQGLSASKMTAAKVLDVLARLPGCAGQASDAASAYTQVKMENAPKLSECPDFWIRLQRYTWPKT